MFQRKKILLWKYSKFLCKANVTLIPQSGVTISNLTFIQLITKNLKHLARILKKLFQLF